MARDLREALLQIAEIRQGIARAGTFRGYRAPTVAFSGASAVACGIAQAVMLPDPAGRPERYVALCASAAALNLLVLATALAARCRRAASAHETRLTLLAVEHLLPSVLAGGVVTATVLRVCPENLWLLPGLWSIIFGLGVFASARLVCAALFWIGGFYLLAGAYLLSHGPDGPALSPWSMLATFACGQFMTATILRDAAGRNADG